MHGNSFQHRLQVHPAAGVKNWRRSCPATQCVKVAAVSGKYSASVVGGEVVGDEARSCAHSRGKIDEILFAPDIKSRNSYIDSYCGQPTSPQELARRTGQKSGH